MAVPSVVFNGTRVDSLDATGSTGHWGGSGAAPSAEPQNAYQNALCINKLSNAVTFEGIDYDPGSGALDMTLPANKLWFVKVYVNDSFDVDPTFGVAAGIGSANNAFYKYNLAGTGSKNPAYTIYPAQGGYILTAIDPNVWEWRDGSGTGSPALTAVDWFGVQSAMVNGNAKSENLAFDAIDVGTGLTITAGDDGSTEGKFTDFLEADQNSSTIRWGCCSGSGVAISAWCMFTLGSSAVTEFIDTDSIVTFKDGYHSAGAVGVSVGLHNFDNVIQVDNLLIGEGSVGLTPSIDTRPDFMVNGVTGGTFHCAATMKNFNNIQLNSLSYAVDADLECQLLTQQAGHINNSVIRTNAPTSIACLQDPTFGISTELNNTEFIQSGSGHAIELGTSGVTHTFTNLVFTGYGADASDDAAIDVTSTLGTMTINYTGAAPTVKTAGTTVILSVSVPITVTVVDTSNDPIATAQTSIHLVSDNSQVMNQDTNGSGVAETTFGGDTPSSCYIRVRKGSTGGTKYIANSTTATIENTTGLNVTIVMQEDPNNAT